MSVGRVVGWGLVFLLGVGTANACSFDSSEPEVKIETRVVEREVEVPVVETVVRMPTECETLVNQAWTAMGLAADLSATQGAQIEITQQTRQALADGDIVKIGQARGEQNDLNDEQLNIYQGLAGIELQMEGSTCDLGEE